MLVSPSGQQRMNGLQDDLPQSAASEVLHFASVLSNRAQELETSVNSKLDSVMRVVNNGGGPEDCKPDREYPPLFSELRINLQSIERSLNSIAAMLARTEL